MPAKAGGATAWRGALEFAGFPVNVRLYNRKKNRSSDSFKTIAPDGNPVRSVYLDSSGNKVESNEQRKAVKMGKDQFLILTPEQIESIKSANRSDVVQPKQLVPLETLPLELALGAYEVVPDDVPGADRSANLLWNGLKSTSLAYVTDVVLTTGGRDAILAVYATDKGMFAVTLPYENETQSAPASNWTADEKASKIFSQAVDKIHGEQISSAFDHSAHASEYAKRREAAVLAAKEGRTIETPEAKPDEDKGVDLMAALEASLS
jgi:non-homologous end joining protein Ku